MLCKLVFTILVEYDKIYSIYKLKYERKKSMENYRLKLIIPYDKRIFMLDVIGGKFCVEDIVDYHLYSEDKFDSLWLNSKAVQKLCKIYSMIEESDMFRKLVDSKIEEKCKSFTQKLMLFCIGLTHDYMEWQEICQRVRKIVSHEFAETPKVVKEYFENSEYQFDEWGKSSLKKFCFLAKKAIEKQSDIIDLANGSKKPEGCLEKIFKSLL